MSRGSLLSGLFAVVLVAGLLSLNSGTAHAQAGCPFTLSCNVYTNSGSGWAGLTFQVEALKSVKICRLKPSFCYISPSPQGIQIWYRPGPHAATNSGWQFIGQAYVPYNCPSFLATQEIPVDINITLAKGEIGTFAIFNPGSVIWGKYGQTPPPNSYQDSYILATTQSYGIYGSSSAPGPPVWGFTFGQKFHGEIVYKEGCFIPQGSVTLDLTNSSGGPLTWLNPGATILANYQVLFPDGGTNTTFTAKFWRIGGSTTTPDFQDTWTVTKLPGTPLSGQKVITVPTWLTPGYYRIETMANSMSSCPGVYMDLPLGDYALMVLAAGQTPCLVWPGDANNDGIVNYSDRRTLNKYIFDANLRPTWLTGPARYRADVVTNPFTYYTWAEQPAVPWQTPDGCYVDTDGNGQINNFDYIAMKQNWAKMHGGATPKNAPFSTQTFDMDQNYPNPFNPSTSIRYSVPEASTVTLTVTDMLGRVVATLVNGRVESGVHSVDFDASSLNSGSYQATVFMTGIESGLTFTKSMKMVLSK